MKFCGRQAGKKERRKEEFYCSPLLWVQNPKYLHILSLWLEHTNADFNFLNIQYIQKTLPVHYHSSIYVHILHVFLPNKFPGITFPITTSNRKKLKLFTSVCYRSIKVTGISAH